MSTGLLYSIDERYKNKNLIYDFERGEIIDPETGVVVEDHLIENIPSIRASDYAEWESKRQHEVLISEKDKRLYSAVWNVGEKIGAPRWLRQDVVEFLKKIDKIKCLAGYSGSILKEKFVLAVYYVLALKRGLTGLAEYISGMECGDGDPCYATRRIKDKEFGKYKIVALKALVSYL